MYFFGNILHANVDIISRRWHNPVLDIINAIFAIILLFNVSNRIEKTILKTVFSYFGKITLPILGLHFLILRLIFTIEVGIGISNSKLLYRLTPYSNTVKSLFYTCITIIVISILDYFIKNNKVYKVIFRGKIRLYQSNKLKKRWINITIILLCVLFFISSIPYDELESIYEIQDEDHSFGRDIKGYYKDGWIGKEFSGVYKTKKNGMLNISFWISEFTPKNTIEIYIDNEIIYNKTLNSGTQNLVFNVPANTDIFLKIKCSKSFVPNKIQNNSDERELSIILSKVKFE